MSQRVYLVIMDETEESRLALRFASRRAVRTGGIVHIVATPAELKSSSDDVVQQFINGRSSGPMETPGF